MLRDREFALDSVPLVPEPWLLVVHCVEENREGKSFASGAHIIGRQAHIMAIFSSIMVQIDEVKSSSKQYYKYLRKQGMV